MGRIAEGNWMAMWELNIYFEPQSMSYTLPISFEQIG